ncbi:hypothetical protein ACFSSA_05665 [Luteolibacter algae]|uniref:Secreted protein n=1 Tax=Luteolibacter algae TaxID=454151 RepID=A0ABW5D815_9BACT
MIPRTRSMTVPVWSSILAALCLGALACNASEKAIIEENQCKMFFPFGNRGYFPEAGASIPEFIQ